MPNSTVSTIIAIALLGGLLFIVPLVTLTARVDNVTQENVKLIVQQFVTEVANTGKMTRSMYQDFENKLYATGNIYDIEIELHILDENPKKKTAQANYKKIGENVYVILYNTQILPAIGIKVDNQPASSTVDTFLLKEGDIIFVEVKSENSTANQTLESSMLGFSNAGENAIIAGDSAMITTDGVKE